MANEQYSVPRLPFYGQGYGLGTPWGSVVPPGGRVAAYVRSTGAQDYDDPFIGQNLVKTLSAGLARCRANMGDTVYLMPGHSETFTDNTILANLVAGTRIVGLGRGATQPKLRITNTAGSFLWAKADVTVTGIHFALEGANGITKAMLVTAADNMFIDNDFEVASGATAKSAIVLEVGAGAHRIRIQGNVFRGTATHNVTDGIKVVSAVTDAVIRDNEMVFSATAGNGLVHLTAAALSIKVMNNLMYNTHTASTAVIDVDDVAADGVFAYNAMCVLNNGTASAQGILFGGGTPLIKSIQNYCCDEPVKSGILAPGAAT